MEEPLVQPARYVWRLPVIRHVRWVVCWYRLRHWYGLWSSLGYYENNTFDRRCLDQVWRGIV
jgi:hypothetical protein